MPEAAVVWVVEQYDHDATVILGVMSIEDAALELMDRWEARWPGYGYAVTERTLNTPMEPEDV